MNIELVETEALIQELLARFDHAVFAGIKCRTGLTEDDDKQTSFETVQWIGNARTCQGLSTSIIARIEAAHEERREPPEGDW